MGRRKRNLRKKRWLMWTGALAAAGVLALGLDSRLAVLTDLHACFYGEGQADLLSAVAEQSPDLVLLGGDIVDDDPGMPEERALETVEALAARWPVYYVTGNHEFWTGRVEEVKDRLRARGAVVLEGVCRTVEAAGQTIQVAGVDDPAVGEAAWRAQLSAAAAGVDGEHFSLLLTHRPERVEDYAGLGFDLILAGHAHGGQWRLPGLINGLIAPDQGLFPRYAGGRYRLGESVLLVSRGLARESTRVPRLFNRPELVVVEVVPAGA